MKRVFIVLVGFICFILLVSFWKWGQDKEPFFQCTDAIGCVTIEPDEPVQLGVLLDMTGFERLLRLL